MQFVIEIEDGLWVWKYVPISGGDWLAKSHGYEAVIDAVNSVADIQKRSYAACVVILKPAPAVESVSEANGQFAEIVK